LSRFSSDWLALREPRDHKSRYPFSDELAILCAQTPSIDVVDLGAGTGSNLRYLAPSLGPEQRWLCVDNDAQLLESMRDELRDWCEETGLAMEEAVAGLRIRGTAIAASVRRQNVDLANDFGSIEIPSAAVVTCTALLDLVSRGWLEELVDACRRAASSVLFALTYSGEIRCSPGLPDDALVERLVNAHQLTDKGFGPALGPAAAEAAAALLRDAAYAVKSMRSDWKIPPNETLLQSELIDGWHAAAVEIEPREAGRLAAWRDTRHALVSARRSEISVSHADLFARQRS